MIYQTEALPASLSDGAPPRPRILLVEGDPVSRDLVEFLLLRQNFEVSTVAKGDEVLQQALRRTPDLIVLEIVLPGLSGLEVCKQVRADRRLAQVPILILSAKTEEADCVRGFESGADDYVIKPFGPRELVCRVRRLLRKQQVPGEKNEVIRSAGLEMDVPRHEVISDGKPVKLTVIEFKLLSTLIQRKGRVQSRDRLLQDVWEYDSMLDTRTVDTHMLRLRKKLGSTSHCLETVRGMGYRYMDS
jgi:two-component system phosphate regulon response regulator PhoB